MSVETKYVPTTYMCGRIKVTNGFTRSCAHAADHAKHIDGREIRLCDAHKDEYEMNRKKARLARSAKQN